MKDIKKEIQEWIDAEERAGRAVDETRLNQYLQLFMRRHNSAPRDEFNGLSPEQMHNIMYYPFTDKCVVELNTLEKEQYEKIPLVRQTLFLLNTLAEKDLKLTKLGWLPLKIVDEAYLLGQPDYYIQEFQQKRINEYEATSVWMARVILELLGWTKIRKGMLSLTVKGKKGFSNIDAAANEILRFALIGAGLHNFDAVEDDRIGNLGMAYSVWILNKYGAEWHSGKFYENEYQKAFHFPSYHNIYETRIFERLFYWLGIVEERLNRQVGPPSEWEFRKTPLLSTIFSFKKV